MSEKRDPTKPFWIIHHLGNLDGTIEFGEGLGGEFDTEAEAMEAMRDEIEDEDPTPCIVYVVTPVAMAKRRKMSLTRLDSGKPSGRTRWAR